MIQTKYLQYTGYPKLDVRFWINVCKICYFIHFLLASINTYKHFCLKNEFLLNIWYFKIWDWILDGQHKFLHFLNTHFNNVYSKVSFPLVTPFGTEINSIIFVIRLPALKNWLFCPAVYWYFPSGRKNLRYVAKPRSLETGWILFKI